MQNQQLFEAPFVSQKSAQSIAPNALRQAQVSAGASDVGVKPLHHLIQFLIQSSILRKPNFYFPIFSVDSL